MKEALDLAKGLMDVPQPNWLYLEYKVLCWEWVEMLPGGTEEHRAVPELERFIKDELRAAYVAVYLDLIKPGAKKAIGTWLLYETLMSLMTYTFEEL